MTSYIRKIENHTNPYVMICKAPIDSSGLSFRAKGLLVWLIGRPPNWITHISHLSSIGPDGPDAIRSALKELKAAGYVKMETFRDEGGRIMSKGFLVSETPDFLNRENPFVEKPSMAKPAVVKHTLIRNDSNKDRDNKEITNNKEVFPASAPSQPLDDGFPQF